MENTRNVRRNAARKPAPLPRSKLTNKKIEQKYRNKVSRLLKSMRYLKAFELLKQYENEYRDYHWYCSKRTYCQIELGKKATIDIVYKALTCAVDLSCYDCLNLFLRNYLPFKKTHATSLLNQLKNICSRVTRKAIRSPLQKIADELRQQRFQKPVNSLQLYQMREQYKQRGVYISRKFEIKIIGSQNRILQANDTIIQNQEILRVPLKQIITVEVAKKCPYVSKLLHLNFRSPRHTLLAIYLLKEKRLGVKSKYYWYISTLPKSIENFPVSYTSKEFDELEGTYVLKDIVKRRYDLQVDYGVVMNALGAALAKQGQTITKQEFFWARMMVCSRIFGMKANGVKTEGLVPIADMFNHDHQGNTQWYYDEIKEAIVIKNKGTKITSGSEVTSTYGDKCNSRLLVNYGFAAQENKYNQIPIILTINGKQPKELNLSIDLRSEKFMEMLDYYRDREEFIFDERKNGRYSQGHRWKIIQVIILKDAIEQFQEVLRFYKTAITYDLEKEGNPKVQLSTNMRNIMLVRIGEKRILKYYIQLCQDSIHYIECGKLPDIARDDYYFKYLVSQIRQIGFYQGIQEQSFESD